MSAKLLEGKPVADAVLNQVAARAASLCARGVVPGLATILVGDDPASTGYVRKKHEACAAAGFWSENVALPASTTQDELHAVIDRLNADHRVHAFLIQHPLPRQLDFGRALLRMDPDKDADGLHPTNLGRLALGDPGPIPATPAGVRAMLVHYGIPTSGRHVVVLGRGPTLGRPLSMLLSAKGEGANAAVTVIHSGVGDLAEYTTRADILIAGVGQPGIVQPNMVREGAVVVSAGITWEGKRLLPDVDESVGEKASWITPRLGGVGVTTVAMLLRNTVALAEARSAS
ncbi:MAG TPA: tetrahydrofolate dehydrogenase/cyclohydrolase catalytic domain-containing protein [Polyangiaceae bacterium]|nr:tetrahydrofolate dehydrogenase/cyclohydrolase catalytic domain-containing protein [Polyangiaceae bacterium]